MLDEFLARAAWYTDDSIKAYVALTVIFAIAYRALYKLFDRAVAPLSAAYRNLSRADQIEWNSRMISNVNAFTTAVLGIMDVCGALLRGSDIILASTPMACLKLSLLGGYLLHDLELVLAYENLCTKEMVLHHLIGLIGNGLSIVRVACLSVVSCVTQRARALPNARAHTRTLTHARARAPLCTRSYGASTTCCACALCKPKQRRRSSMRAGS